MAKSTLLFLGLIAISINLFSQSNPKIIKYDFKTKLWSKIAGKYKRNDVVQVQVNGLNPFVYSVALNKTDSNYTRPQIAIPTFGGFTGLSDLTGIFTAVAPSAQLSYAEDAKNRVAVGKNLFMTENITFVKAKIDKKVKPTPTAMPFYLDYTKVAVRAVLINKVIRDQMERLEDLYYQYEQKLYTCLLTDKTKTTAVSDWDPDKLINRFKAIKEEIKVAELSYDTANEMLSKADLRLYMAESRDAILAKAVKADSAFQSYRSGITKEMQTTVLNNLNAAKDASNSQAFIGYMSAVSTIVNLDDSLWISQPVQVTKDVTTLTLAFTPKDVLGLKDSTDPLNAGKQKLSTLKSPLDAYSVSYKLPGQSDSRWSLSSGFFWSNLVDESYSTQFVNDSTFTLVKEGFNKNWQLGVNALAHIDVFKTDGFSLAFTFGPGMTFGGAKIQPRLLIGGSIGIGNQNRLVISTGLIGGNRSVLSKAFNESTQYHGKTAPTYLVDQFQSGFFLSLGYSFLGGKDD